MKNNNNLPMLSQEEWENWTNLTKRIKFVDDKIPVEAFYAFCESFISPVVDVIPYRINNSKLEILLIYRKDKYYDGFHLPGSVIVPGRTSQETLNLIISKELGPDTNVGKKYFVKVIDTMKGIGVGLDQRGQDLKLLYACEIKGLVLEGQWFAKENLPENIIPEHQKIVLESFEWIKNPI